MFALRNTLYSLVQVSCLESGVQLVILNLSGALFSSEVISFAPEVSHPEVPVAACP